MIGLATPAISIIIPLYFIYGRAGMLNSYGSVVLTQVILFLPMAILMMRNFFDGLPRELLESAIIDGASKWQAFYRIYLPLAKIAVANITVLVASWSFKDFLAPLIFITKSQRYPATVAISTLVGEFNTSLVNIGRYNAALLLLAIPPMLIYLFGRRFLQSGVTEGAVKG